MFTPSTKFNGGAKVGACTQGTQGAFGGGCDTCGAGRPDGITVLGLDGIPQTPPLGIQVGLGSAFVAQSGAAVGQAADSSQGFNLATGAVSVAWVMTFTPNCAVRLAGLFIDPAIASDLQVQAVYCGWTGYQQQANLLSGRPGSNINNSNYIPGIMFSLLNQQVPGFQTIDAVFTNTAPVIITGRTIVGCDAFFALASAIVTKAA